MELQVSNSPLVGWPETIDGLDQNSYQYKTYSTMFWWETFPSLEYRFSINEYSVFYHEFDIYTSNLLPNVIILISAPVLFRQRVLSDIQLKENLKKSPVLEVGRKAWSMLHGSDYRRRKGIQRKV